MLTSSCCSIAFIISEHAGFGVPPCKQCRALFDAITHLREPGVPFAVLGNAAIMELSNPYGSRKDLGSSEDDDLKELRAAAMEDNFKRGAHRRSVLVGETARVLCESRTT
jgi:hypothetical protein